MKALLIDLDDTLFDELSYVRSGYDRVAKYVSACSHHKLDSDEMYNYLLYNLSKYGRKNAFDALIARFEIEDMGTAEMVDLYCSHLPKIKLYPGVEMALDLLRKEFKIAIVTDGRRKVQERKIFALKLEDMVDSVVFCMQRNHPKPSGMSYLQAVKELGVDIQDAIIIGDDPYCDIKAAHNLNIKSYRILGGKHADILPMRDAQPTKSFGQFIAAANTLLELR